MRDVDFAAMLRTNALFGTLDSIRLDGLARLCFSKSLPAGALLFQKGDPGDALYGVRRGQIAIEIGTIDGQRMTLSILGSGDLFGEIAVLDGLGRTADAVALEATELFALRRSDLLAYLEREPRVAITLIEGVCGRLRSVSDHVERCLTLKLDARLAQRLVTLAEDFGDDIVITQDALARYVGATRESVNRQLRVWQSAGLLEIRRGAIRVKDLPAMIAMRR